MLLLYRSCGCKPAGPHKAACHASMSLDLGSERGSLPYSAYTMGLLLTLHHGNKPQHSCCPACTAGNPKAAGDCRMLDLISRPRLCAQNSTYHPRICIGAYEPFRWRIAALPSYIPLQIGKISRHQLLSSFTRGPLENSQAVLAACIPSLCKPSLDHKHAANLWSTLGGCANLQN